MHKIFSVLVSITLLLALVVVLLGAYTRLSDAGLGCPDWPGCYGHISVPASVNAQDFQRPLEATKAWKEMLHRYAAGTLGLLIIILFVMSLIGRNTLRQGLVLPFLLVITVIFQALLGMWTVTELLHPLIVTGHLIGGFTTLGLVWLLWLNQHAVDIPTFYTGSLTTMRWLALLTLILVMLQIFLGGWTSTHYAAIACGLDFPKCQGQWWPPTDFVNAFKFNLPNGVNYEFGTLDNPARTAIQLTHRIGALLVLLVVGSIATWFIVKRISLVGIIPSVILFMLLGQISLGIMNVLWGLPLWLATAHTLGAALLLLAVLALNQRLYAKAFA